MISLPLTHRQSAHCESGVVSSLLAYNGVELSEPMVFGLAWGLTFAYIPFAKVNGMPLIAYRMPPTFIISSISRRLGIPFVKRKYHSPAQAQVELDSLLEAGQPVGMQTSVYWLPYFPDDMRFNFNGHNLIVYGKGNGEYLVSDPVIQHTTRIAPKDLTDARFAKGLLAPHGQMYYPVKTEISAIHWEKVIRHSIRQTSGMMLHAPLPFIGIRGIRTLAHEVESWKNMPDQRRARSFLAHIIRMQEEIGTGGGGFRFIYAAFLAEAGEKMGNDHLRELSKDMTAIGDIWRTFAGTAAYYVKRKQEVVDYREIAAQLRTCADREQDLFRKLLKI